MSRLCYLSIPLEVIKNINKVLERNGLMLPWGVFDEVHMRLNSDFWNHPSLSPCAHTYAFRLAPSSTHDAYIKPSSQSSPPFPKHTYTHIYTHFHHLTNNAFKYLSKKSYRTLNQLKNSRKGLLLHVFNTIFTKKTQGGSSNLLFLSRILFTLSGM